jgi:hypothetical protein
MAMQIKQVRDLREPWHQLWLYEIEDPHIDESAHYEATHVIFSILILLPLP